MFDDLSQELLPLFAFLHKRYATQAARPARHWWQWPRGLAWFQVLMIWSLVKPSVYAERLSRIGDYLCAARGPGLLRQCKSRTAFPHARSPTRDPPYPLFHRRRSPRMHSWLLLPFLTSLGPRALAAHEMKYSDGRRASGPRRDADAGSGASRLRVRV